jgi:DNA-binding NarL/FixJ family response regulator
VALPRIVVVTDDAVFRKELRRLFDRSLEFQVVAEVLNPIEALETVKTVAFDLLLVDLRFGWTFLEKLGRHRNFKTLVVAANIRREDEINAILLGGSGIVRKYAAPEKLLKSIRAVLKGQIWAKRDLTADLIRTLRESHLPIDNPLPQKGLSSRELEIIRAVSQGLENKEISERLGISSITVKHYLGRIFDKLNLRNRVELALFAIRNGLGSN